MKLTILSLAETQTIIPGEFNEMNLQVDRDDDLSFQGGGFVAKETGDYRVTGSQRVGEFDGTGKVELSVLNGETPYVLASIGNTGLVSGSRVIHVLAGEKLTPSLFISGSIPVDALVDTSKNAIVFEKL